MSYSKIFLSATILCGLFVITITASAKEKKSYERSVYTTYRSLPANTAAMSKTQAEIGRTFKGWGGTADKLSGYLTDAYGQPIEIDGADNRARAGHCMEDQLKQFGVTPGEWRFVSAPNAPKADYVNYTEVIRGHSVVFSKLSFRFTKEGRLARVQMKSYGSPAAGAAPSISKDAALKSAMQDVKDVNVTSAAVDDNWCWFPVPAAGGYKLSPAWKFRIEAKSPGTVPLLLTGYVDAITGVLLYRTNEVRESTFDLTVKAMVKKDGPVPTLEPLADLNLTMGWSTGTTGADGRYTDASVPLPVTTDIPLSGSWSQVIDDPSGITPSFSPYITAVGTYTYPATLPASSRHINAYYHTTRVHNFMKGYFPLFTGMDAPLPTYVDVSFGYCNAYFDGSSINFFQAGGGCNSFAEVGDVVYHEYGHGINSSFYDYICGTPMINSSLHEGYADMWAINITHSPVLGRNCFAGLSNAYIRRYDVTPQVYPIDLDVTSMSDPHKNGQIIAGAWWDLAASLGTIDSMTTLFTQVYYDYPDGPNGTEGEIYQAILVDALMADDDDANLYNGTPHYNKIIAAFARHGVYLEGDVVLAHEELQNPAANTAIPVTAVVSMFNASFFKNLTMYYRVNSAGTWTPVVMSNAGGTCTGTIPAQIGGSAVEYYFVLRDTMNQAGAYFPITCNPAIPANQATIPFQFPVGVKVVDSNDFSGSTTGYGIGGNAGDNAVAGQWFKDYPIAFGISITGDHTSGTGECLMALSDTDMLGTTSVLTPVFNISGYTAPVIEYYRWFANGDGYDNFKDDPWVVKIRDASGSSWVTVENTYQGDLAWRRRVFPVKAFLPATATQVQLKFFASDSVVTTNFRQSQSIVQAGIDDIYIYDRKPTGVAAIQPDQVKIFPNPANEAIYATLPTGVTGTLSLWDMNGRKVMDQPVKDNITSYLLSVAKLPAGAYSLLVETGSSIQTKKVVITHAH